MPAHMPVHMPIHMCIHYTHVYTHVCIRMSIVYTHVHSVCIHVLGAPCLQTFSFFWQVEFLGHVAHGGIASAAQRVFDETRGTVAILV